MPPSCCRKTDGGQQRSQGGKLEGQWPRIDFGLDAAIRQQPVFLRAERTVTPGQRPHSSAPLSRRRRYRLCSGGES